MNILMLRLSHHINSDEIKKCFRDPGDTVEIIAPIDVSHAFGSIEAACEKIKAASPDIVLIAEKAAIDAPLLFASSALEAIREYGFREPIFLVVDYMNESLRRVLSSPDQDNAILAMNRNGTFDAKKWQSILELARPENEIQETGPLDEGDAWPDAEAMPDERELHPDADLAGRYLAYCNFSVDTETGNIFYDDRPIKLKSTSQKLMAIFIARASQSICDPIGRNQLREHMGISVKSKSIADYVGKLRQALEREFPNSEAILEAAVDTAGYGWRLVRRDTLKRKLVQVIDPTPPTFPAKAVQSETCFVGFSYSDATKDVCFYGKPLGLTESERKIMIVLLNAKGNPVSSTQLAAALNLPNDTYPFAFWKHVSNMHHKFRAFFDMKENIIKREKKAYRLDVELVQKLGIVPPERGCMAANDNYAAGLQYV